MENSSGYKMVRLIVSTKGIAGAKHDELYVRSWYPEWDEEERSADYDEVLEGDFTTNVDDARIFKIDKNLDIEELDKLYLDTEELSWDNDLRLLTHLLKVFGKLATTEAVAEKKDKLDNIDFLNKDVPVNYEKGNDLNKKLSPPIQ